MNSYTLYAVDVDSTLIDGVFSQRIGAGIQKAKNFHDGSVDPRYVATLARRSTIEFSTKAVAVALGVTGARGAAISSSATLFFYKNADDGERAGASSHLKMVVGSGLIVPRRLSANQDGEAELTCEIIPISSDGSTDPITITDSQSLAGTPDADEKFTIGPASVNGTDLDPQSIEVDFGIEVITRSHSGFYLPVQGSIRTIAPTIRVSTADVSKVTTIGLSGLAQSVTDSLFYLRKLDENGTRVANGTAEHVKLSVDDGQIHMDELSADEGGDAVANIQVDPTYDGSNATVVLSAASAIT